MIRYLTKCNAIPPIYRALTTNHAYAEAISPDRNSEKSLISTVHYVSHLYSQVRETPYSTNKGSCRGRRSIRRPLEGGQIVRGDGSKEE